MNLSYGSIGNKERGMNSMALEKHDIERLRDI